MFLIIFDCDNGENCHCHRRMWEETELFDDCDNEEDAKLTLECSKELLKKDIKNRVGCRTGISAAYLIEKEITI